MELTKQQKQQLTHAETQKKGKQTSKKEDKNKAMEDKVEKWVLEYYSIVPTKVEKFKNGNQYKSYLVTTEKQCFVFKMQKQHQDFGMKDYQLQDDVLLHLQKRLNDPTRKIGKSTDYPQIIRMNDQQTTKYILYKEDKYYFRMLSFINHQVLEEHEQILHIARQVGQTAGILDKDLEDFKHQLEKPALTVYENLLLHKKHIQTRIKENYKVEQEGATMLKKAEEFFDGYEKVFLQNYQELPSQLIHNDIHGGNILTDLQRKKVKGLIDFGWTMRYSLRIMEVVFSLEISFRFMFRSKGGSYEKVEKALLRAIGQITAGYCKYNMLSELQLRCIYYLLVYKICGYDCKRLNKQNFTKVMMILNLGEQVIAKEITVALKKNDEDEEE